jgi:hypothetical protein
MTPTVQPFPTQSFELLLARASAAVGTCLVPQAEPSAASPQASADAELELPRKTRPVTAPARVPEPEHGSTPQITSFI